MTLADEVAAATIRLNHLELKNEADENLIDLLKQQNEIQAMELTTVRHEHNIAMQRLRQERDVAVRNATEVRGIIETIGMQALSGVRKMRGDETPPIIPDKPPVIVKHLQTADRTLPPVKREHDELLPRPAFLDRPRDPEREYPEVRSSSRL